MTANHLEIRSGVVRPIACYQAGWALIKDQYWLFLGVSVVGMIIAGAVPFAILMGPMMCGEWKCLLAKSRGQKATFEMLFKGFDHFLQSLIACLIMIVPALLVTIPLTLLMWGTMIFSFSHGGDPGSDPGQALLRVLPLLVLMIGVMMILSLVLGALFLFTFPLIVDRGLGGFEAVKTSATAVVRNLGGVLGLVFLNLLLSCLGALLCYVGAFFVMPFSFAAMLAAYRAVFDAEAPTVIPRT